MGKKINVKHLPQTKAESVEKRLEELANNKSITLYEYLGTKSDKVWVKHGECRLYPDGFEAVIKDGGRLLGYLHVERRNFYVCYNVDIKYEKNKLQIKEEK